MTTLLTGLLQRVMDMQSNAQAALPVIPNNGNPNGANNMPSRPDANPATPAMPAGKPDAASFYPWLKASPSMDAIQSMLKSRGGGGNNMGIGPRMPQAPLTPVVPEFRNRRQAARAEGDFYMMPKRGEQMGIVREGVQELLPTMPQFRGNERF